MVRHKVRWLLVRFDFEGHVLSPQPPDNSSWAQGGPPRRDGNNAAGRRQAGLERGTPSSPSVSTGDIYHSLRESMSVNFGLEGLRHANNVDVRLYDDDARMAMIRTPVGRACDVVRASLTLLGGVCVGGGGGGSSKNGPSKPLPAVASAIAVCGSVRTARLAAIAEMHRSRPGGRRRRGDGSPRPIIVGDDGYDGARDRSQRDGKSVASDRGGRKDVADYQYFKGRLAAVRSIER